MKNTLKLMFSWYKHQGELNPLRRLTYTLIGVVAVVPITIIAILFINMAMQGWDNTFIFGVKPTLIITDSMEPIIMTNSIVIVEPVEFDDIKPGDIIRFNIPNNQYTVVHRVESISYKHQEIHTKGDNNELIDNWVVKPDMVLGKVTHINNGISEIITLIFGKFDTNSIYSSMLRAVVGLVCLALTICFIVMSAYYTFEIITIHYYLINKKVEMSKSTDWMLEQIDKNKFNTTVNLYKDVYNKSGVLKKIWLRIRFMRWYDVLCTNENKARRSAKYTERLNKYLNRTNMKR